MFWRNQRTSSDHKRVKAEPRFETAADYVWWMKHAGFASDEVLHAYRHDTVYAGNE
jgi:hypothetical protein